MEFRFMIICGNGNCHRILNPFNSGELNVVYNSYGNEVTHIEFRCTCGQTSTIDLKTQK